MRVDRTPARGIALVECLIYIAVCTVVAGMLVRFFLEGMQASARARALLRLNTRAQLALACLRRDWKQARTVLLPGDERAKEQPPDTVAVLLMQDGRRIRYVCSGNRLRRYVQGARGAGGESPAQCRTLAGRFAYLRVAPLPTANRVFRLELGLPLGRAAPAGPPPAAGRVLRYVTAVQVRRGEEER